MCQLSDFLHLELLPKHKNILRKELELWHEAYLPIGKRVLDIGAGCGETAEFYLNHGAEFVVCVEGDPGPLTRLYMNFGRDPRVLIVPMMIDSVKVDIEGSEEGMVYETHWSSKLRSWKNVDPANPTAELFRLERLKTRPKPLLTARDRQIAKNIFKQHTG